MTEQATLLVWDRFVRIFHWLLLVAFIVAKASEGEPLTVHVWAGYVVGVLVIARVVWGFAGPKYARFSDFIYSPRTVFTYLRDVFRGRAQRYVGHNPAGGAMIVVLLISLSATVFTGLATLAEEENAGPLAPVFGTTAATAPAGLLVSSALANGDHNRGNRKHGDDEHDDSAFEDVHDFFAHFTLFLALFHVAGVLLSSLAHRENLIWSMVIGRKQVEGLQQGMDS
jgi:cytochrome b